jgi:hypothetical protein
MFVVAVIPWALPSVGPQSRKSVTATTDSRFDAKTVSVNLKARLAKAAAAIEMLSEEALRTAALKAFIDGVSAVQAIPAPPTRHSTHPGQGGGVARDDGDRVPTEPRASCSPCPNLRWGPSLASAVAGSGTCPPQPSSHLGPGPRAFRRDKSAWSSNASPQARLAGPLAGALRASSRFPVLEPVGRRCGAPRQAIGPPRGCRLYGEALNIADTPVITVVGTVLEDAFGPGGVLRSQLLRHVCGIGLSSNS